MTRTRSRPPPPSAANGRTVDWMSAATAAPTAARTKLKTVVPQFARGRRTIPAWPRGLQPRVYRRPPNRDNGHAPVPRGVAPARSKRRNPEGRAVRCPSAWHRASDGPARPGACGCHWGRPRVWRPTTSGPWRTASGGGGRPRAVADDRPHRVFHVKRRGQDMTAPTGPHQSARCVSRETSPDAGGSHVTCGPRWRHPPREAPGAT